MNKKRIFRGGVLLLWAAVLWACLPLGAQAAYFRDVPVGAWYRQAVLRLADDGILTGTGGDYYSPGATLTRGAFVTMLARSALSEGELDQYAFRGNFRDVGTSHWANLYVNWAAETRVVSGYEDGTFRPGRALSRQEAAVMVKNFADSTGRKFPQYQEPASFADQGSIASWARESVRLCQQSEVMTGDPDGRFRPGSTATRAEAAVICYRFLENCETEDYTIVQKRVNNTPVRAVIFSPHDFEARIALGQDMVDGGEGASSLVSRTGAAIAVNGAFFNMDDYTPVGTLISEGRILTIDNERAPHKAALVMAPSGEFFVESFTTYVDVALSDSSGVVSTLQKASVNHWPTNASDATRLIMTRDWGTRLNFSARDALVVDAAGTITAVYHNAANVDIPQEGYVLCQHARRENEGNFFDSARVGMTISLDSKFVSESGGELGYDPVLSLGAGPRLVKNGQVYGNSATYAQEGFSGSVVTGVTARVCAGILPSGELMLLNATGSLRELSYILEAMGCQDAVNLDGGGSTNLYVDGQWLYGPQGRKLNNMLCFVR